MLGLLFVGAVAVELLRDRLTVSDAALRVGAAFVVLLLVDRLLLPVAQALVGERRPVEDEQLPDETDVPDLNR